MTHETKATRAATKARASTVDDVNGARTAGSSVAMADGVVLIEPRPIPIVKATDLGSVQVLKHGNLFLLTDQFGDIHSDSRGLGLYFRDTRILSCSVLRVSGLRPVVLQGSTGANFQGVIQLTNPTLSRNPDDKIRPGQGLSGKKLGITRARLIDGAALKERVRIVNFAEHEETVEISIELAHDAADIFEVRGFPRERGTLLPVALTDSRVTFRYDGVDGKRRRTHVVFGEDATVEAVQPDDIPELGGCVRFRW
jgi:glycogen debranching enzyme